MSENKRDKIPEDISQEVIELASQLYAEAQKKNEGFSLSELQDIGNEVSIPDEIMTQALAQIEEKYRQKKLRKENQEKQIKILGFVGLGLSLFIAIWGISSYNSLNGNKQEVMAKWAQVENQLQRKADLIPSLINITQAQANHEKELITLLTNARQQYLLASSIEEKLASSEQINQVINKVNSYALSNNNLASSQAFSNLQYEIAGTENRIATERKRYNESVQKYNQKVQSFPNSIVANLTGSKTQSFFQSSLK